MKIRTKFFVAGFAWVAAFIAALFILNRLHRNNARTLLQEITRQDWVTFDALVKLRGEPLKKMIQDYTYWDEMVDFLRRPRQQWARENIDELLINQKYDALWLYTPDGRLVYSRKRTAGDILENNSLPLPSGATLLADGKARNLHFFLQTPAGLMELYGATVHPTDDPERKTPPRGFFFVGQLWNDAFLRELAEVARAEVFLTGPVRPQAAQQRPDEPWSIVYVRRLPDLDGRPLAVLHIHTRALAIGAIIDKSSQYLLIASLFLLALLGLMVLAIFFWIDRPMQAIVLNLDRKDRHRLGALTRRGDEFARLADLIVHFFDQQKALESEMVTRQRMEEQLRQSQKLEAVGRLAGGIAHDFNNLLTVILGYSDMLLHTPELNERLQGSVRQVHRAAEQAASLTRQLLAFGRKQLLQSRPLNLNGLIGELEPMLRRLIGENILMDLDLQADPADIVADPAQINQVVMNLVLNARDAMPEGGRLSIETRLVQLDAEYVLAHPVVKPGDYVQLAVGDSGIGMDRETQEHMFEPFFSTKEKGKGTGLGLATVYGIVKQSGGYVWVYSELGSGSVFKIYLPLAAPAQADCAPPRPPPASGGNETVLVVEDKPEVRALVRDVLTPAGYAVYEVDSPEAALRFCRESGTSVQLLLTDVVLPGMNGAQLASEMTTRYPQVRVLYMSGYTDNAIVRQRILAPGKNYLQKPFTPGDLLRRVREALDG